MTSELNQFLTEQQNSWVTTRALVPTQSKTIARGIVGLDTIGYTFKRY